MFFGPGKNFTRGKKRGGDVCLYNATKIWTSKPGISSGGSLGLRMAWGIAKKSKTPHTLEQYGDAACANAPPPQLSSRWKGGTVSTLCSMWCWWKNRAFWHSKMSTQINIVKNFFPFLEVSLYPSVMKNSRFPLGMPQIYGEEQIGRMGLPSLPWDSTTDFGGDGKEFPLKGLHLVRILLPQRMPILSRNASSLLPPFLPFRTKEGLLVFTLCSTCAEKQQKKCRHNIKQRSWVDGFCDEDLQLALTLGYKIMRIHEAWVWPDEQWTNPDVPNRDLFRGYINSLLTLKVGDFWKKWLFNFYLPFGLFFPRLRLQAGQVKSKQMSKSDNLSKNMKSEKAYIWTPKKWSTIRGCMKWRKLIFEKNYCQYFSTH